MGALKTTISNISVDKPILSIFSRNLTVLSNFYIGEALWIKAFISVLLFAGIVVAFFKKSVNVFFSTYQLLLLLMPMMLTVSLKQSMFDRTWIYFVIPVSWFLAYAFSIIKSRSILIAAGFVVGISQWAAGTHNAYYKNQLHEIAIAKRVSGLMIKNQYRSIYLDHAFVRPMIEYHLYINKYPIEMEISRSDFRPTAFNQAKQYDIIVSNRKSMSDFNISNYTLVESSDGTFVLKRIDSSDK
jgi:hypothetical protein